MENNRKGTLIRMALLGRKGSASRTVLGGSDIRSVFNSEGIVGGFSKSIDFYL